MGAEGQPNAGSWIREFRSEEDAAEVAMLLEQAPEATLWHETDLRKVRELAGVTAFVSITGDRISGILIGRKVGEEGEILNLAVRPKERRKGEGRRLVERLLEGYRLGEVSRVFLEVRESNSGAMAFYERLGFHAVGRRKAYYQQPREDALVMERGLWKSTDTPR